jgi:O-antigen ligase
MSAPHVPVTPEDSQPSWPARLLAVWLGMGAAAVVLAAVSSSLFDLDRFAAPKELVLHLTALGALLAVGLGGRGRPSLVAAEIPLAAFAAWSALSALLATNYWLASRALAITVSGLIVFHAAYRIARRGAGGWLLRGLGIAFGLAALTGLAQAYGLELPLLADSRAPGGTLGNRNFLAHLMAIGAPVLLLLFLEAPGRREARVAGTGLALMVAALVLTRSRASWLGLMLSFGLMGVAWLVARRGGREIVPWPRLRAGILTIGLSVAAALLLPNSLNWRSDSPYRDTMRDLTNYREGSGRGRLIQYRNSAKLARMDPLFGTGPGNWPVKYPLVTTRGDPSYAGNDPMPTNPWPSSDWVAFLSERGGIAVLLLLSGLAAMGVTALRRLRRENREEVRRAIALLGVLTATVVTGAFDAVLLLAPPTLLVWASAGVLLPESGIAGALPLSRWRLSALAALLLLFAAGRSLGQVRSIALAGPGWPVERLQRAVRYDPGSYRLHLMIAQRTSCARGAGGHAFRAARLFPHLPAPHRRMRQCGRMS